MRTLVVVFALALVVGTLAPTAMAQVCPAPAPAVAPCPQPCPPAGAGPAPMLTDDQLVQMYMSCSMGLSPDQIRQLKAQGLGNGDIVIAYAVAAKACVPVKDVVAAFLGNKDWDAVFAKYNVTLGDLSKCNLATSSDVESFNRTFLAQYYGVSETDVAALREKGVSWGDISLMANASVRTTQPISTISDLRAQGMSWSDIATKFNICLADIIRPVQMRTATARAISGSGPMVCPVAMYDSRGNILLSYDMATNLYTRGFDWLDVAIAANVSKSSGIPIENLLERVRAGAQWDSLLVRYGVAPSVAYNVSDYPFPRSSVYSKAIQQMRWNRIETYQSPGSSLTGGVVPCGAGPASPCPAVCPSAPAPSPAPCPATPSSTCPPASESSD